MWTLSFLVFLSITLGIGAWLLFMWSVKKGQYEDAEDMKYRMLEDDDIQRKKGAIKHDRGLTCIQYGKCRI
ncbi:cbb3-type cytochrome oxidase assembly protein CcoS [Dissulfurispira sp.]|uniref:cbb3-type cytochrome oxidase assembly protein CcoS n=1 Tax=Dissulfurispira sp. TaxID=2817609 RepID=UPI002FD998AA